MDWFPAVMSLVGVALGAGIQEIRLRRERKDKYKDMVFEKRLDAHQGAYYWCLRVSRSARPDNLLREGGPEGAIKESWKCLEWLHKNALYLDEGSASKMNSFIVYIIDKSLKSRDEAWRKNVDVKKEVEDVIGRLAEVTTSIRKGVGVKYLPEERIPTLDIETGMILEGFLGEMAKDTEGLTSKEKEQG
jgi:hypothetical protein